MKGVQRELLAGRWGLHNGESARLAAVDRRAGRGLHANTHSRSPGANACRVTECNRDNSPHTDRYNYAYSNQHAAAHEYVDA
jgi:hypothetical protein